MKDLLVEGTTENPRYKGVVNALMKAQVAVAHKPFSLQELRSSLEGADMDAEREQARAAEEKAVAKRQQQQARPHDRLWLAQGGQDRMEGCQAKGLGVELRPRSNKGALCALINPT